MTDTATPETGPVDAPASIDSVLAEFEAGGEAGGDALDAIADELVNEAEGAGEAEEAPETEDDATEPAEDDAEAEEGDPEEPVYTVKVAGEERQVPLTELLKGYSRTEDYKQKTAAVAEERRALEAQKGSLEADLKANYANQLEEATSLFAQADPVLAEARKINWEQLKATDPAAFVQAQDAVNARWALFQQTQQQIATARQQAQQLEAQRTEQERAQRFDMAAEKIVSAMPELADEAKFTAFAQDAVGYLRGEGFDQTEIAEVLDHRVLTLANKARQWDAHVAAQKALPEKRVVTKSAVKPLTTDGNGSRAPKPRFPGNASKEAKGDWIAQQILSEI